MTFPEIFGYVSILYLLFLHLPSFAKSISTAVLLAWREVERVRQETKEPIPF